jgi:2-oxoisovalerate dehydrogenase E1 component alpha subunit
VTTTFTLQAGAVPDLEPIRLLHPDGHLIDDPRVTLELSASEHLAMYEAMVVTRAVDQEHVNLQRQGQLALFPSCRGQEGAQVGAVSALRPDDMLFPQYRELGAWVVRGVDPVGIGMMWRGSWHGGMGLLEGRSSTMAIPIGTQALHAVGYAMGIALDGADTVAVACIGDGATSEGDVHEAMNFAAVFESPCIFFVQNNQYAISVPLHQQTRSPSIAHKAVAYGMPGVRCDGNDVLATFATMREAAAHARSGGGPVLVEAVTYRLEAHTTSDDPTRYRSDSEVDTWARVDPLTRYRNYLRSARMLTDDLDAVATERAACAATRLREGVFDAPDGDPLELFEHVFAATTPALQEQRGELADELARAEGHDGEGP